MLWFPSKTRIPLKAKNLWATEVAILPCTTKTCCSVNFEILCKKLEQLLETQHQHDKQWQNNIGKQMTHDKQEGYKPLSSWFKLWYLYVCVYAWKTEQILGKATFICPGITKPHPTLKWKYVKCESISFTISLAKELWMVGMTNDSIHSGRWSNVCMSNGH